jgi:late competence protein required for DNA uptake (superfamily II DNA/RNA helicase)
LEERFHFGVHVENSFETLYNGTMRAKRVPNGAGEYKCARCQNYKPMDEYYKSSQTSVGIGSYCKACVAEKRRENLNNYPVPTLKDEINTFLRLRGFRTQWRDDMEFVASKYDQGPTSEWDTDEAIAYLTGKSDVPPEGLS